MSILPRRVHPTLLVATLLVAVIVTASFAQGPPGGGGQNNAPTITITATSIGPNAWSFSGVVTDETPGNMSVSISGAATGYSVTLQNGSYSVVIMTYGSGTVTASVTDGGGKTGTATCTISN